MCGIAGEVCFNQKETVEQYHYDMLDTMGKRGPDANGIYHSPNSVLLHARLAVIDIENGKQPMSVKEQEKEYTIVYNGELYNTEEVRSKLRMEGEVFRGHSDTEVLLKAYIHWKENCLDLLNGIFAFAIWNKKEGSLFIARDRMGVKPFFYSIINGKFIFASEIKTLLAHPQIKPIIDLNGIAELFFIGPGRTQGCGVFRDIKELPPAYCGVYDCNGLRIKPYWRLTDHIHEDDFETTVEKVRTLVIDSIEKQLVSDVPIGTFLSGGLDSSIISSVAKRYLRRKGEVLQTFSVTYRDNEKYFKASKFQPNSDEHYIDIMQKYLGSNHHSIVIDTPQLVEALYRSVDARDLPGMADVDSSLLLFCNEIKQHVTVALSGECADEIFGGYPWFRDEKIRSAYGFPWAQSTAYRNKFLKKEYADLLHGEEIVNRKYEQSLSEVSKQSDLSPLESRMREMVHLNMNWFMQTLLDRKDRMSMYNGLEVRVPFCDYRIAEYLYSTPWSMKDYEGREKGLLRLALQDYLPEEIVWRKKSPYPKTHNPGYLSAVSKKLEEILKDKDAPLFAIAEYRMVKNLLTTENAEPWYGQLMTTPQTIAYFIQMNYWLEKYQVEIEK